MKLESFKQLKIGDKIKYQNRNGDIKTGIIDTIVYDPESCGVDGYGKDYMCRRAIISKIVKKKKLIVFPEHLEHLVKENQKLQDELNKFKGLYRDGIGYQDSNFHWVMGRNATHEIWVRKIIPDSV